MKFDSENKCLEGVEKITAANNKGLEMTFDQNFSSTFRKCSSKIKNIFQNKIAITTLK